MSTKHALVIAACSDEHISELPDADIVIAADGGVDVAHSLGRKVDVLIGDFDSASAAGIAWAETSGAQVERHPQRKDFTDLELALTVAVECARSVHVIAAAGGRLDHSLGNLMVLASQRWACVTVSATIGSAHIDVVRDRCQIRGNVGDTVSLIAIGGPAQGVVTSGLEYSLNGEQLQHCTARGVSNVIRSVPAEVVVSAGVLFVINPGVGW